MTLDTKSFLKRNFKRLPKREEISGPEVESISENCKYQSHPWLSPEELANLYREEANKRDFLDELASFGEDTELKHCIDS